MSLKENLIKIAFANEEQRRDGLLSVLRENKLPFILRHNKVGDHWVQNIMISINKGTPRIVIGAHYDSLQGSCGANDNAAAVCILIELAKNLVKAPPQLPIDIVFFDREKYADHGSEEYINYVGRDNILAMINLDICGVGDTIVLGPRRNLGKGVLAYILASGNAMKKYQAEIVDFLPPSDDKSFEKEGIPNISMAMIPKDEIESVVKLSKYMFNKITPPPGEFSSLPSIMETIHNGDKDNTDTVQEEAMNKILSFLCDAIYCNH